MLAPPVHWGRAVPFEFSGVPLVDIDVVGAVESLLDAATRRAGQGLHLCNSYTLSLASHDVTVRDALRHPGAVNLPDGAPVSWYFRLACRRPALGPVRGPSLMRAALARPGLRHYLLGGTDAVLIDLEQVIAREFPGAVVAGRLAPPFGDPTPSELASWASAIREANANVVWVGLGTPRQDLVISELVGSVGAVLVGVGAAFDFLSGHKSEAPSYLHRTGLEWTFRLASEPRRLWRRYLVGSTRFALRATRQLLDPRASSAGPAQRSPRQ